MDEKERALIDWSKSRIGCPYIFGNTGQICTPKERLRVITNKPAYRDAITNNCPVLSGKLATCRGCRWEGKPSYDCRGLTREAIRAVTGRPVMGAGATSQWKDDSNWVVKGPIAEMPDLICLVFTQKGDTMSHTGIRIGNTAIHASGHVSGVIESPMPRSFTHYAIPVGLYKEGGIIVPIDEFLIRIRDQGLKVRILQESLIKLGYSMPRFGADGKFGAETEAAVRQFQQDHSLVVDGVWDALCQKQLETLLASPPPTQPENVTAALELLQRHRDETNQLILAFNNLK